MLRHGVLSRAPRLKRVLLQVAGVMLLVVIWAAATAPGMVSPDLLPGPVSVAASFAAALVSAETWGSTLQTFAGWAGAIAVALAIGMPVGLLIGRFELAYRSCRIPMEFLRAVPPIALIPVIVLLYGQTSRSAIILASYGAVWPILVQTAYGVRAVDPALKDTATAYGLGRVGTLRHLIIPAAMPYVLTGFSVSSALALIAVIGSEIIVGIPGLGAEINMARAGGQANDAYALTIWSAFLGLLIARLTSMLRLHLLRWQPRPQGAPA